MSLSRLFLSLIVALFATSCDVKEHPICVNDCPEDVDAANDGVVVDAFNTDAFFPDSDIDAGPCIPQGAETCNGIDDDCNGLIDDGTLPGTGAPCSSDVGECTAGTTICQGGNIECSGVVPTAEICDGLDNNCDGNEDEGNPEGGQLCGTSVGECETGITECQAGGNLVCNGDVGPSPEVCNGLDDDCNGNFDEGTSTNNQCGPASDNGQCVFGTEQCIGGTPQCVGAVYPTLEQCDAVDRDCDGNTTNGFDLDNDAANCGSCGNACTVMNGVGECSMGTCGIAVCDQDYWDLDGGLDCEYGPCVFNGAQEACNGIDDDCDGTIDEDLIVPDICDPDGECAPGGNVVTPTCMMADGWRCVYGSTVETDVDGNITQETLCDGLDNDCDLQIDDGDPNKGQACDDGGQGICRGTGTFICDPGDAAAPVICDITSPGETSTTEVCNGLDDNCDGTIDNGVAAGALQTWVSIDGNFEIFAYEASRPDATNTAIGAVTTHPCSNANALPWTNVTHPQAEAACAAIGARLCTEAEWQDACESTTDNCEYSYGANCDTYSANTCNGNDYDTDSGTAGDQDGLVPSGSLPMCFAEWGAQDVFDLSGNAKEWTAERSAGINPQRGGSTTSTGGGMTCDFDFAVADDEFFFPNVGFRCCR